MKNLLPFLVLTLWASAAVAEPPEAPSTATSDAATALVTKRLLTPLRKARAKRKVFSRAAPVPTVHRVRVLDAVAQIDVHGKRFVRFAIDEGRSRRKGSHWRKNRLLGCVYVKERKVFVQIGEEYHRARGALGQRTRPQPAVCRPDPNAGAQLASAAR